MLSKIFSRCAWLEVFVRFLLARMPNLKAKLKNNRDSGAVTKEDKSLNERAWNLVQEKINAVAKNTHIIIVHSSMDGLGNIGVTEDMFLEYLLELSRKGCTIVLPAFPITNLKDPTPDSRPYNPQNTPCWTGMLPNIFISSSGVIRSAFPFNSLAAIGPQAEEMMKDNSKADYVYGEHSAWKYCVDHHAAIVFVGVSSLTSNTIAGHMIPDVMGDAWPIDEWYLEQTYKVKVDGRIYNHTIFVQDNARWSQYCVDYRTEHRLEVNGIVDETTIDDCCLGIVKDSKIMVDFLINDCQNGKMMFMIPRKYYKKNMR